MKFTKEEALEKLKGHLTNNGRKPLRMSERSLEGHIDDLMSLIANDETELDDFFEKAKGFVERANSNAEKDKSDFIKDWKAQNPITPKPQEQQDEENENDPNKVLLDRIAALEGKIQAEEKNKAIGQKRRELKAKMKDAGIADADWTDMVLSEIAITEDLDVAAKAESLVKLYNKQNAASPSERTPARPSRNKIDKSVFDDVVAIKKKRDEQRQEII